MSVALTPRQREFCDLLCAGHTVITASAAMGIAPLTARGLARDSRANYGVRTLYALVDAHSGGQASYKRTYGIPRADGLSAAEYAVLELAATGLTWTEICVLRKVGVNTVYSQSKSAYRKLGVSGKAAALAKLGLRKASVTDLSEPFSTEAP